MGSEEDVNKAVAAAKAAFESFQSHLAQERLELLESCVEVYQKYYNDIADAIREEMGAPQELAAGAQAFCGLGHLQEAAKILKNFQVRRRPGRAPGIQGAHRCLRPDHTLELAGKPDFLQGGARAGGGLHHGAQAQ